MTQQEEPGTQTSRNCPLLEPQGIRAVLSPGPRWVGAQSLLNHLAVGQKC
jgi:hypothetical protein